MSTVFDKIGFGGGCHWCTEAVFIALRGVSQVQQGFIQSEPPHNVFSEAVIVHYNPTEIDLAVLIEAHLRTHASTSQHKMRNKYRSAVYAFNHQQLLNSTLNLTTLQASFDKPLITKALTFVAFKASDERFQRYYQTDPTRPFCKTYIDPKLALLRQRFSKHYKA